MTGLTPTQLLGDWTLRRRVVDRRLAVHGIVVGTLALRRAGGDVRWLERGQLWWQGRRAEVWRELRLREEEHDWQVLFADGRPFHPWRPGQVVRHQCRDDLYRGLIDVSPLRVRILWDVTGPGKDQRIVTRCTRL